MEEKRSKLPGVERPERRKARKGFTMIELAVAISILTIGVVSVISATSRMHTLRKHNRERMIAQNAMRSVSERIHARSHLYSEDLGTWAGNVLNDFGPGGVFGDEFDVRALTEAFGQDVIGTIQIVTDERTTDADLGTRIGMPRDLNGDGDANDGDVTNDAVLLPVIVTVRWRGQAGTTSHDMVFYLMGY